MLRVGFLALGNATSCSSLRTCSSCTSNALLDCTWCATDSRCVDSAEKGSCAEQLLGSCDQTYYTIILLVVIACFCCLCCATCYVRRLQQRHHDRLFEAMFSPLLPQRARQFLFRNSLGEGGENEWMCIICGFDNKPRNKHCTMCGTSHEFSLDYKGKKIEQRRERQQRKEKRTSASKKERDLSTPLLQEEKQMDLPDEEIEKSFQRITSPKRKKRTPGSEGADVAAAEDAQIPSISFSLKFFQTGASGAEDAQLSTGIEPLSAAQRTQSLNFRRMNQLSLRQKSARRRKMWQRRYDEQSGALVWVRVPVKETKVGSAPFGYTPGNSFAESRYGDNSLSCSLASQSSNEHRVSALDELLIAAGAVPSAPQRQSQQYNPLLQSGSPMRAPMNLRGEERARRKRADSFGDAVLLSTSPGFTSVFDEQGDLQWQRVEPGEPTPRSQYGPTVARFPLKIEHGDVAGARLGEIRVLDEKFDLAAVAAYTFKDKQIWFLDRTSEMQRPWTEGFVRIEVRRSKLLEDSHRAWSQLRPEDLHKWMRFQFHQEPGVDAGGLEREWFMLVVEEIFSPQAGLFTRCGNEATGSYHINPISGAINANHLSFFRFVGRVLGKAMMEQQSIKANLSLPLRKQLIGMPVTFSDLEFVDEELFRNLLWLKKNDDVSSLLLDFSISYTAASQTVTYELVPNGHDVLVTDENKQEYLQLRLRHRLLDSIKMQLENLLLGFYEVIPPEILSIFDYQELDLLICGVPEIDLDDWIRHTEYLGEYHQQGVRHSVVKWFWESVRNMSQEERVRLLQFATGCARLPVQGFKALQSSDGRYRKFNIQSISKTDSVYPRAHTCFNKLDLPLYDSKEELDAYLSVVLTMDVVGFTME